ncbi:MULTISPECIES: alpha/beta fold hydrolase [unclassified Streptomyces]|uniref:alpha/beta fold hydrolase n=1 Tax=unclassified Streptomyces TaxID=2593676 RepID=UPI00365E30B6
MNTTDPTIGTLAVPGATLYHERRGSGPVLLLIPGGGADAGLYAGMAGDLAAGGYAVVSFDPRGQSRSPLDGPATDHRPADRADDAHRLLELHSPHEPAYVLGCSAGAVAALDLLARHPERVRRVVAHEPPLVECWRIPRRTGPCSAGCARCTGPGERLRRWPTSVPDSAGARTGRRPNCRPRYGRWRRACTPTCPCSWSTSCARSRRACRTWPRYGGAADRLALAAGRDSRAMPALYGPARRPAELTGAGFAEFPGGHVGCTEHPGEFAALLLAELSRKN